MDFSTVTTTPLDIIDSMLGHFVHLAIDAATEAHAIALFQTSTKLTFLLSLFLLRTYHQEPHDYKDEDEPDKHVATAALGGCGVRSLQKDE